MPSHRVILPDLATPRPGDVVPVGGQEARHALRVKRLGPGEAVEVLDGKGLVVAGTVANAGQGELVVRVEAVHEVEPLSPRVEVIAATPKGGRADEMVRGLSQVGAASWAALETGRGQVRPRATKLDRLSKLAAESAKQCGRAWVMEVGGRVELDEALAGEAVVADASGAPYEATAAPAVRLLVGPEGGWTEEELTLARQRGARVCSFGAHAMRVEVAAVVAAAIVIDAERRGESATDGHG